LFVILGLNAGRRASRRAGGGRLSIAVTVFFDLTAKGVTTVERCHRLPLPSLPVLDYLLALLIGTAFGIALVAVGDTISTSTGFAPAAAMKWMATRKCWYWRRQLVAACSRGFRSAPAARARLSRNNPVQNPIYRRCRRTTGAGHAIVCPGLVKNMPNSALAAILLPPR